MTRPPHQSTVSIADDDRARIPFALIAVLLLVSSIAIIGAMESRSSAETDTDVALAMDRSTAAAQGELRNVVMEASHEAAAQPVTTASMSELETGDEGVFENYLKLLILKNAEEALSDAGQDLGSGTETEVSLAEPVESDHGGAIGQATDGIEFRTHDDESYLEQGMVEVEFTHGITIDIIDDGEVIHSETTSDLEVVVGTPVLELKDKTDEYDDALSEGFFDSDPSSLSNLAHHSAARLYPFVYFKSAINRADPGDGDTQDWTFEDVLPHDRTEVLTNSALFGVQNSVFGVEDPYKDRVMRPAWACLLAQVAMDVADIEDDEDDDDDDNGDEDEDHPYELTVRDEDGIDVNDASVLVDGEFVGMTGGVSQDGEAVDFDSGEVTFDHPAEYGSIEILHEDHDDKYIPMTRFETIGTVEIDLQNARSVKVIDSNGNLVSGAQIEIVNEDGEEFVGLTDNLGDFRYRGTGGGTEEIDIEITSDAYEDFDESYAADETEVIELEPSGDGEVVEDNEPLALPPGDPDDVEMNPDDVTDDTDAGVDEDEFDDINVTDGDDTIEGPEDIDELVCGELQEWLFGDADGDLPDPPTLGELLTDVFDMDNPMAEEEEILAEAFSSVAYYQMTGDDGGDLSRTLVDDQMPGDPDTLMDDIREGVDDDPFDNDDLPTTDGGHIDDRMEIVDEIYEVDADRYLSTDGSTIDTTTDPPHDPDNYTHDDTNLTVDQWDPSADHEALWDAQDGYENKDLHEIDVTVDVTIDKTATFVNTSDSSDTYTRDYTHSQTVTGDLDLTAHHDFEASHDSTGDVTVQSHDLERDFESGGELASPLPSEPQNYQPVIADSLDDMAPGSYSGSVDSSAVESNIESELNDAEDATTDPESEINDALDVGSSSETYDFGDLERDGLDRDEFVEWLEDDLESVRYTVDQSAEELSPTREELLRDDEPYDEMEDNIEELEEELVYESIDNEYRNVPQLVRAQTRQAYFELMYNQIDEMNDAHTGVGDIGDELGDLGGEDSPIDDALGFIQDIFAAEPTEQQSDLESGPLMNEMEYEIETSPTYLNVNESVDNEEVPSVRPPGSSVMDLDDGEHRPMATSYTQRLPTPGLPLSPVPPALYYLQLNSYNIELDGEYSRFEVSATAGDPASGESTTFVRDQMDVEVEIGGEEQKIGEVDPIDIDASTEIVVFMPGAVPMQMGAPPNVGEPTFGEELEDDESDNWDDTGPQHPSD